MVGSFFFLSRDLSEGELKVLSPALSEGEGDVSGEVVGDLFFSVFGKDCFVSRNDGLMWFLSPALSEGEGDFIAL